MEIGELLAIWRAHSGASPHPTACRNGRQKSPQARASTGVPLEDTRARRSHLAGSLLFPTLMGPYIISVDLSGPASSPFITLMTDMETRPHCIASSITVTSHDSRQNFLKFGSGNSWSVLRFRGRGRFILSHSLLAEEFSPNGPERSRAARRQGAAKPPLTARTVRRSWAKREWLPGAWDTVPHTQPSILSRHFEGEVSENRARREFENIGERIAVRYTRETSSDGWSG